MIDQAFPSLSKEGYSVESPKTTDYNCISWAVGMSDKWWWPDQFHYWPTGVPVNDSIAAFVTLFHSLGFKICHSPDLEENAEKVAIFARNGRVTHVARQLSTGKWTSKLGNEEDIEHALDGLVGSIYGSVVQILMRKVSDN